MGHIIVDDTGCRGGFVFARATRDTFAAQSITGDMDSADDEEAQRRIILVQNMCIPNPTESPIHRVATTITFMGMSMSFCLKSLA